MGHPVIYYSPSHPEGRLFDSGDSVGPEWVDHPHKVAKPAETAVLDLAACSDEALASASKDALEEAARDQLGIELDRRKSVRNMIREIREAQEADDG